MDPNANLEEQLRLASSIQEQYEALGEGGDLEDQIEREAIMSDAARLAELVLELNTWIKSGGFLPDTWKKV